MKLGLTGVEFALTREEIFINVNRSCKFCKLKASRKPHQPSASSSVNCPCPRPTLRRERMRKENCCKSSKADSNLVRVTLPCCSLIPRISTRTNTRARSRTHADSNAESWYPVDHGSSYFGVGAPGLITDIDYTTRCIGLLLLLLLILILADTRAQTNSLDS